MDGPEIGETFWLEFMFNAGKLKDVLGNRKVIPQLCIQFAERAYTTEREAERPGQTREEAKSLQRKAANLWLCALACFSSIEWDFEFIVQSVKGYDLVVFKYLIDQCYKKYLEQSLDATFGNWIFYRYTILIDTNFKLPQPPVKATLPTTEKTEIDIAKSLHQANPADQAFIKNEKVQKMLSELREHMPKARAFVTEMMSKPKDLAAPSPECFYEPFKASLAAMGAAMSSMSVDENEADFPIPQPDFTRKSTLLPLKDVENKCCADLVSLLFLNGEFFEAKKLLPKVVKSSVPFALVNIDEKKMKGFSIALDINGSFNASTEKKQEFVYDLNLLSQDQSPLRQNELHRYRAELETSGSLNVVYKVENAARNLVDGVPECVKMIVERKDLVERFVKALKRLMARGISKDRKTFVQANLQYLCSVNPDISQTLHRLGYDMSGLSPPAVPSDRPLSMPVPTVEVIRGLIQSNDPWWKMLIKSKLAHLKEAVAELKTFYPPQTFQLPYYLTARRESQNLIFEQLLLGKLNQLANLKNMKKFEVRLKEYLPELCNPGNIQQMQMDAMYEMILVRTSIANSQIALPFCTQSEPFNTALFAAIFKPEFRPQDNSFRVVNQCLTAMLNLGENQMVIGKAGTLDLDKFLMIKLARLLGVYASNLNDVAATQRCASTIHEFSWKMFLMEAPRGRRRTAEGVVITEPPLNNRREVTQLVHFIGLIRAPELVNLLLSMFTSFYNKVSVAKGRSQLKVYSQLSDIFVPDTITSFNVELVNFDDIRQCLRIICQTAFIMMPNNKHVLHTCADFNFAEGRYFEAGKRYMEYFYSQYPDDMEKFDYTIFSRLQPILANFGYLTEGLLALQFTSSKKKPLEYKKAIAILKSNETRDIGGRCSSFFVDDGLVDILSDIYYEEKQTRHLKALFCASSNISMNRNVRRSLTLQDQTRRFEMFMESLSTIFFSANS